MSDIDGQHRRILTQFGVAQMTNNPAGIGNECTHWIYAALLEARALDYDAALHIAQTRVPYTWGRPTPATSAMRGDIAQFHSYQNTFAICHVDGSGNWAWLELTKIRGPNHTGMVFTPPQSGAYYQLESHLHEAGTPIMQIRGNTIYHESFAIALTAGDAGKLQGSTSWPADVDQSDIGDLLERVDWTGMRGSYSAPVATADALIPQIKRGSNAPVQVNGKPITWLMVVHQSGDLKFYCPQSSSARLAMNDSQFAAEKAALIATCIRGGRPGGRADQDQYGGDNKIARQHDNRFDWTYKPH